MMKRVCRLGRHLVAWAILALAAAASAYAGEDRFDGNWHFDVTPYLWSPYVDGTVN